MKTKLSIIFLLVTLLLGACGGQAAPTSAPQAEAAPPASAQPAASTAAETPAPPSTSAAAADSRKALLSEVEHTVSARVTQASEPAAAVAGLEILPGGGIETGVDGRARLDLLPEGTIVRVGPNSAFNMPELSASNGAPKTTLELLFGKVYILLNGGSLEVQTPGGVASVQGSVMSVEYDLQTGRIKTACLEGHCKLEDEEGNEVELTDGEMSFIEEGEAPTEPEEIDSEEIEEWLEEIPEMPEFFEELPDPADFPEPEITDVPGEASTEVPTDVPTVDPGATVDPGGVPDPGATADPGGGGGGGGGDDGGGGG